ncbi:MAG: hypothetical protein RI949_729 [Pseudomonadota bacterium]|jgi:VanZ family protein
MIMWTSMLTSPRAQRYWKVLLWMGVVVTLVLALVPTPPKALSTGWDKADHLGAFGCLAVAGSLAWGSGWRRSLWLGLTLVAFGGLIEILQSFIPYRQADWRDLLADSLGVLLGLVFSTAVTAWKR